MGNRLFVPRLVVLASPTGLVPAVDVDAT